MLRDWSGHAGDPGLLGWLIAFAYLAAALAAWRAGRAASPGAPPDRTFWRSAAVALLLLGINKQLDLQTLLTQFGREMARANGWYGERRLVQAIFIAALAAGSIGLMVALRRRLRASHQAVRWAIAGLAMILLYVLVRAASFHHTDLLLGFRLGTARFGHLLELVGIAVTALSALAYRGSERGGR